jgi:adenine deaminase
MKKHSLIRAASGAEPVDLLVTGGTLVNTLSGEIHREDIAVRDGLVVGLGSGYKAENVLDATGKYICPALVEGHIHIESTLLSPVEFARVAAGHGTGAVVCDPHEIANVLGRSGVEYMLEATADLPMAVYCMVPSCVPATHLEHAGAELSADDIASLFAGYPERIPGLAEMMNFPGVLAEDPNVLARIAAAGSRPVDGHAPGLTGLALNGYIMAGPGSDHESCTAEEALEKLRKGMHLMIREGSSEKNLRELLPVLNEFNSANVSLVTDDRHADDLVTSGHLDYTVRLAMEQGVPAIRAIQMASINTARHYGLTGHGALAPGYRADFIVLDDLDTFSINTIYLQGGDVRDLSFGDRALDIPENTVHAAPVSETDFQVPARSGDIRVMDIVPEQIVTRTAAVSPAIRDGLVVADPGRDLAKLAVLDRHHGRSLQGIGFVRGLGLERGAIAGTVAHDSHNLVVAGMSDTDMVRAVRELCSMGGGLVAVSGNRVLSGLALPIAGLMSTEPVDRVADRMHDLRQAARSLGCPETINPFMILSFLSLPVIPELRLTDMGLVDVAAFDFVSLWMNGDKS